MADGKPLTRSQAKTFFDLVERAGSRVNGERVIGRLRLGRFVEEHGKAACQAVFDAALAKQKGKAK